MPERHVLIRITIRIVIWAKFRMQNLIVAAVCLYSQIVMSQEKSYAHPGTDAITAARISHEIALDARHPVTEWQAAETVSFSQDWQGKNVDPERETRARGLWTPQTLYFRFECRDPELFFFEGSEAKWRRDQLLGPDLGENV